MNSISKYSATALACFLTAQSSLAQTTQQQASHTAQQSSPLQSSTTAPQTVPPMPAGQTSGLVSNQQIFNFLNQYAYINIDGIIIETAPIKELYKTRQYAPIWFDQIGLTSSNMALKNYLLNVREQGLNPSDYLLPTQDKIFAGTLSPIWSEIVMSHTLIKIASELSNGRFDPEQVDNDIRYKRKNFTDFDKLNQVISAPNDQLAAGLNSFAPQSPQYKGLLTALQMLLDIQTNNKSYVTIKKGAKLVLGQPNPLVLDLRQALIDRGFALTGTGNILDQELLDASRTFMAENNLSLSDKEKLLDAQNTIGSTFDIWRALSATIDQRVNQVMVGLEKLRWLPKNLESTRVFVNLAATEFKLYENDQITMQFETINGQPQRRTPSMRDEVFQIILNPDWTAPDSIAAKDEVPQFQKNIKVMEQKHYQIFTKGASRTLVDGTTLDWKGQGKKLLYNYYVIQQPWADNALGVVKFNLKYNTDQIYMHDTNERYLFDQTMRLKSSGCIRLQKPFDFAVYLLKNQLLDPKDPSKGNWTEEALRSAVPDPDPKNLESRKLNIEDEAKKYQSRMTVELQNRMPVYTLYLTSELDQKTGRIRFFSDYYGQDTRVAEAIKRTLKNGQVN